MKSVMVEGRRIAYHRAGSGPTLLLLHGGWSDGRMWWKQLEGLSDEFDVVAWDASGCGASDDPRPDAPLEAYADAVAGFVIALGLDRPHLCGLSWGGGLALAVYRRHPELPRSLALASAYAGWKGSLSPEEVDARIAKVRGEIDRPPDTWIDEYLPGFFAGEMPREVLARVRAIMLDVRAGGTLAMLSAFAAADLRDVLPTVMVPTLLLCGDADIRSPLAVGTALAAAIPDSELVVLPGVGHVSNLEAPPAFEASPAFDAEVRRFLRSVD